MKKIIFLLVYLTVNSFSSIAWDVTCSTYILDESPGVDIAYMEPSARTKTYDCDAYGTSSKVWCEDPSKHYSDKRYSIYYETEETRTGEECSGTDTSVYRQVTTVKGCWDVGAVYNSGTDICEICTEPDTNSTRPDNIEGGTWEFLGTLTCRSVPDPDPEGDGYDDWLILDTYNNHDGEKFVSSYRKNCCTLTDHWIWNESNSTDASSDENKTCPPGQTMIDDVCYDDNATVSCRDGYELINNVDNPPNCNNGYDSTGTPWYEDIYWLTPDEDASVYARCCAKEYISGDDSDSTDDNSSDSSSSDSDSDSDSNGTSLDLSSLEDKLSEIIKDNNLYADQNHKDLNGLEAKLDKINRDNNSNSNDERIAAKKASDIAHEDAENIKDVLEDIKGESHDFFREIKSVIANNSIEGSDVPTDSNDSGDTPTDDNASAPSRDDIDNDSLIELATSSIETFTNGFNSMKALLDGVTTPVVHYSGTCNLSAQIFGKNVSFSESFDRMLPLFKPFLLFILNLSLAFYLFKLSVLVFWDILNRVNIVTK